jgi:hypothetical protein
MFSYEHRKKPILPTQKFYKRLLKNFLLAMIILFISLCIGVAGYVRFAHLRFVDALQNASMILGGMGPVDTMPSDCAKYFASFYSLFSGVTFLSTIAVLFAPILHRAMHKFHLETEDEEEKTDGTRARK